MGSVTQMNMWDLRRTFCYCLKKKKKKRKTGRLVLRELSCVSSWTVGVTESKLAENTDTFFLSWDQFSVSLWADTWAQRAPNCRSSYIQWLTISFECTGPWRCVGIFPRGSSCFFWMSLTFSFCCMTHSCLRYCAFWLHNNITLGQNERQ